MADRPILFSGPMVRAILAGTKTQTRRVVNPQPQSVIGSCIVPFGGDSVTLLKLMADIGRTCPYGQPGDRLWVRETWMDLLGTGIERKTGDLGRYAYAADTPPGSYGDEARKDYGLKWKPSIHMPRAASRITLDVADARVERLQDISEADAIAEGCTKNHNGYFWGGPHPVSGLKQLATARDAYRDLWESINGPGSWEANPWVWVVEFGRADGVQPSSNDQRKGAA